MLQRSALLVTLVLGGLLVGACRTPKGQDGAPERPAATGTEPIPLTLVATNDVHGWLTPHEKRLTDGRVLKEGGLAQLSGYLQILRRQRPDRVLLFDAGDLFQGTLAANLTEGAAVIELFNALGYDAAALGNHEFDYGPQGPIAIATDPKMDAFGALKARIAQARFPLLAGNITDAATGGRPTWLGNDGTAMLERGGVRIGVIGLITTQTPSTTNPVNVATLRFSSLVPEAIAAAERLRAKGAEVVVALVHAGGRCSTVEPLTDLSSCDVDVGEVWPLVRELPQGLVDVVVAGHTHSPITKQVNGMPVVETEGLGRSFTTIELFVDPSTRRPIPSMTRITPRVGICEAVDEASGGCTLPELEAKAKDGSLKLQAPNYLGETVVPDSDIQALVEKTLARVKAEQERSLGVVVPHTLGRNYHEESPLGSFLADSLRKMEKADIALLNSGGLRADLPQGNLRFGDVYQVIPFDNTVATVTVTGEELSRLLRTAYGAHKGVFQISGARVTLNPCPGKGRLKSFVLENGKAAEAKKLYRVTMPDFLARGGDGLGAILSTLPEGRVELGTQRALNFRDALIASWQEAKAPLIAPTLGRIQILRDEKGCPGQ